MASTYLQKTLGTPTSQRIWTFSAWVKRSGISSTQHIFSIDNGSARDAFSFDSDNGLRLYFNSSASPYADLSTNRVLKDTSAFYHLVIAVDTTQATADDRVKLYINGTQYTWDETTIDPALNYYTFNASGNTFRIGRDRTSANYFDGLMSYVAFVEGTQELPTIFGETDATTGEWKIKTTITPTSGWGNNGFLILKDGNTITDQSSNSNDFTLGGGTLTNTEDCPSNVFATLNPLDLGDTTNIATLSNGNNYYSSTQGGYNMMVTTLGANSGKWYWEAKYISHNMHGNSNNFGINPGFTGDRIPIGTTTSYLGKTANAYAFVDAGNVFNNDTTTTYDSGATTANNLNDIVGIALDLDNNKAYYHVNGTYWNSANPSNGTGGLSINPASQTEAGFYFPSISDKSSTRSYVYAFNFGNGYFGTTAVTTNSGNGYAGTDGASKFTYQPPTGYSAINTKGLNL